MESRFQLWSSLHLFYKCLTNVPIIPGYIYIPWESKTISKIVFRQRLFRNQIPWAVDSWVGEPATSGSQDRSSCDISIYLQHILQTNINLNMMFNQKITIWRCLPSTLSLLKIMAVAKIVWDLSMCLWWHTMVSGFLLLYAALWKTKSISAYLPWMLNQLRHYEDKESPQEKLGTQFCWASRQCEKVNNLSCLGCPQIRTSSRSCHSWTSSTCGSRCLPLR